MFFNNKCVLLRKIIIYVEYIGIKFSLAYFPASDALSITIKGNLSVPS